MHKPSMRVEGKVHSKRGGEVPSVLPVETEIVTGQLAYLIVITDSLTWLHLWQDQVKKMNEPRPRKGKKSQEGPTKLSDHVSGMCKVTLTKPFVF